MSPIQIDARTQLSNETVFPKQNKMRKLEDYPAVPGTPPLLDKDKGLASLENELNQERMFLEGLNTENKEIENIIKNFDKELNYIKSNFPQNIEDGVIRADNELWFKCQAQREVNKKLERERKHLELEIKQIEEQGVVNLDSLTQAELILYVKQLERNKTDLTSELRASEWSLDKQAKESHRLEQARRALDAEIRHYDEELAMFRHYNKTSCPSATTRSSLQVTKSENSVSSLDGSTRRQRSMSPTPGFQRRTQRGGIPDNQRILDPRRGPINRKAAVGNLPSIRTKTTRKPIPPGTPEIVVTDTTRGGKSPETARIELKMDSPLELQSSRNFENSPPPKPLGGFSFEEEVVRAPVAEVSKEDGVVSVRMGSGRSVIIQIRIIEDGKLCETCRSKNM